MIALAIFTVGFFVALKMSFRATLRGAGLLIVALVLFGLLLWSSAASTPDDIFAANYIPEGVSDAGFGVGPVHRVLIGYITGAAAVSLIAYGLGALLGRFAFRNKRTET